MHLVSGSGAGTAARAPGGRVVAWGLDVEGPGLVWVLDCATASASYGQRVAGPFANEAAARLWGRAWIELSGLCRCEHTRHTGQCPASGGCWCDTFSGRT